MERQLYNNQPKMGHALTPLLLSLLQHGWLQV